MHEYASGDLTWKAAYRRHPNRTVGPFKLTDSKGCVEVKGSSEGVQWIFWSASIAFLLLVLLAISASPSMGDDGWMPYDWTQGWTLRAPESIPSTGPIIQTPGVQGFDSATGQDGSTHLIWEDLGNIMYSTRPPGARGFTTPVQLNAAGNPGVGPKVEVGNDGIVHVIWLEVSNQSESGIHPAIGRGIVWRYLSKGGLEWAVPDEVMSGNFAYPDLAILPDGTISVSAWYRPSSDGDNGDPPQEGYRVFYSAWSLDGRVVSRRFVSQRLTEPNQQLFLITSGEGHPHILASENNIGYWYVSTDRGQTWQLADAYIGCWRAGWSHSVITGAVAFDEYHLFYIMESTNISNQSMVNSWIGFSSRGTASTTTFLNSARIPLFSIRGQKDIAWFAYLEFPEIPEEPDGMGHQDGHLFLMAFSINETGLIYGPCIEISLIPFNKSNPSFNRTRIGLSVSIDADNMPVVALLHPDISSDSSTIDIWRFNHAPSEPSVVSESRGGWINQDVAELVTGPALDIDGDPIEYRFTYWKEGSNDRSLSPWIGTPQYLMQGLSHGTYHWRIEVRDPFNGSSSSTEGWWFRVDTGPPRADPGGPYLVQEGSWVSMDGSGSLDDGPIVLWEWDLGGDGSYEINASAPRILWRPEDDLKTRLVLRVTDEAGWRSTGETLVIALNVPPTISISGPRSTSGPADYTATAVDPSQEDTVTITWAVDGIPLGTGPTFQYIPTSLHTHYISAMAVDDDGGSDWNYLLVEVSSTRPALAILGPAVVREGQAYELHQANASLGLYSGCPVVWVREGKQLGTGTALDLTAGPPGFERTDIGVLDGEVLVLCGSITVQVRMGLQGPERISAKVTSYSSVEVSWQSSGQPGLYRRYIVRASTDSLPVRPVPGLGWMDEVEMTGDAVIEVDSRTANSVEFTGLESGWTYYFCVYVVGDEDVASSESVSATIPRAPATVGGGSSSPDGLGTQWTMAIGAGLAIVITSSVAVAVVHRYRTRDRRMDAARGKSPLPRRDPPDRG
jgi:hypothetical protein